jgi:peptidyl-prolyl cis-trans isomerase SurA
MLQGRTGGSFLTIDQLDKDMIPALSKLESGEYSMPYSFVDQRDRKGVKIIYLRSKTDPHRENLNDDYSKIADKTLEEKKENAVGEWFNNKLSNYYIKIDSDYVQCEVMEKWIDASKNHQSIGN